jgi:DNA-binding transcriptional LysR family regulator
LNGSIGKKVDCSYRKTFEQILNQEGIVRFARLEMKSVEVIKRRVMAGVGITVLPEMAVAEGVAQKKLVIFPWSEGKIDVAILMVWYRDRWILPTMKAFMEVTKKAMARADLTPKAGKGGKGVKALPKRTGLKNAGR